MELFNKPVVSSIGSYLLTRNETIAVAESVTCGLLQAAIGTANDARHFYQGGITAYNLAQKYRHLCVEPVHAMKVNCVSQEVAAEMAINVCKLFCSQWGIGITGYATPAPESGNSVFAFFAIANGGNILVAEKIEPVAADPLDIQLVYVKEILSKLHTCIANPAIQV